MESLHFLSYKFCVIAKAITAKEFSSHISANIENTSSDTLDKNGEGGQKEL